MLQTMQAFMVATFRAAGPAVGRPGSDRKLVGVCFGSASNAVIAYMYSYVVSIALESTKQTVMRIWRGQKQNGAAAAPKDQHVFHVLLKVGIDWKYSALKHIGYFGGYKYYLGDSCTDRELMALESSLARHFRPKSVGAAAQDAARLAKDLSGNKMAESGDSGKRNGKSPRHVDTSDNDDDESDDEK